MFTETIQIAPMPSTDRSSRSWLHSPWLRPFNDPVALDDLMQRLLPRAALNDIRARVIQVIEETADTRSFVLHCNRHWRGFRAGQHVLVGMEVRGRRMQRCFSLSSAPDATRRVSITVKRHTGNGVTAWMHAALTPGATVTLSPAFGDFCLPEAAPQKLLMISAGSGITPMMGMLRMLYACGHRGDVVLLHSCRDDADWVFGTELRAMAAQWPALKLLPHFSRSAGRLDAARLVAAIPDFAERPTLLCGPNRFQSWVTELYRNYGASALLSHENFGPPGIEEVAGTGVTSPIHCTKSERSFTADAGQSLLLAAEAAGMSPRHGCRIGICRTCQCRLGSGSVENLLTGEISKEPGQWVQLCISAARSPLTLDL
jgi:stearoyl-CoA 9-desaturase NADPH oxidoreductase